nr:MAG TPA: hypothetical protein [Caudoviricetes sp.]
MLSSYTFFLPCGAVRFLVLDYIIHLFDYASMPFLIIFLIYFLTLLSLAIILLYRRWRL